MRRTIFYPEFRMSFPDLALLSDKSTSLINRDTLVMTTYGIDNTTVTFLNENNELLLALPSDEVFKGLVGVATESRNATASSIKSSIRDIMLRPKMIYGENTANYRSFGSMGMDKMDHAHLFFCALRVVQVAELNFTALEPAGMTHPIIDALKALADQYRLDIAAKDNSVAERDIATEQRITLGNLIYNKIVQVFEIGKTYFFDKSDAKFNDYVIYNTPDMQEPTLGQYGSAHGVQLRSDTGLVPENPQVFIDGVVVPIIPDNEGHWSMDKIPVGTRVISGSGGECDNFMGEITITADSDINFNMMMTPTADSPPA